jgi:hypothetical protein
MMTMTNMSHTGMMMMMTTMTVEGVLSSPPFQCEKLQELPGIL